MNATTANPTLVNQVDELERRVQNQLRGRVCDLHLLLRGHALVLQGFTRTYYLKQLAQHALMNLTDMPILANEIEVF